MWKSSERTDENDVDSAGIIALIISLLTMAGGAARYLLERRRRNQAQDIDGIDKLLERIDRMGQRIAGLEKERAEEFKEREALRNELWTANGRIYQLEQAQNGMLRIITVALEYIDVLSAQVVEAGGKPQPKPPEITNWLHNNHKES